MKIKALIAVVGLIAVQHAAAIVISDRQVLLESLDNAQYRITVQQNAYFQDPTSLHFSKVDGASSSTLTAVAWNVDEEADYYLVPPNSIFSGATIAQGAYAPLFTLDHAFSINVPYPGTFYLGINTGAGWGSAGPNRDVFGWAQLSNLPTGLSLISSAFAYGHGGIIVGTTTAIPAVPELGSSASFLIGLGAAAIVARRRQRGMRTCSPSPGQFSTANFDTTTVPSHQRGAAAAIAGCATTTSPHCAR